MTVPMGSTGSGIGMYGGPSAASETDGETYDDHTDYGDEGFCWDYQEMLSNLLVVVSAWFVSESGLGNV